jgi:hypothetical protein
MWRMLLKGSEWEPLADIVSPTFLDLLPAQTLRREIQQLVANALHRNQLLRIREVEGERLRQSNIPVRIDPSRGEGDVGRVRRGQAVLAVYFHQLYASDVALLDVRSKRFESAADTLLWDPRPVYVRWQPDFLAGVRQLYTGLYEADEDLLRDAAECLGLHPAREVLTEHFTHPNPESVRFSLARFRKSFHRIIVLCRDAGTTLPGNLIPFAIYLGCLHEHLEQLGGAHDVARAYRTARQALFSE